MHGNTCKASPNNNKGPHKCLVEMHDRQQVGVLLGLQEIQHTTTVRDGTR